MKKTFLLSILFMCSFASAQTPVPTPHSSAPIALIYSGPGSCSVAEGDAGTTGYGCSEAASDVAVSAGFQVKFVGPNDLPDGATPDQVAALFQNAKVWIQPGGIAETAFFAMTEKLRTEIVNFVSNGGGYVGFCAGAYMATATIGASRYAGFGIFPGITHAYSYEPMIAGQDYTLMHVTWNGAERAIYFEGGPYLGVAGTDAEVIATFDDSGLTAAARAPYGKGRVFISGPHPEAPSVWTTEDGVTDPDGSDAALAVDMVKWAAGLE
jgi:hypothetical protein